MGMRAGLRVMMTQAVMIIMAMVALQRMLRHSGAVQTGAVPTRTDGSAALVD